jgi:hypothetical protein
MRDMHKMGHKSVDIEDLTPFDFRGPVAQKALTKR